LRTANADFEVTYDGSAFNLDASVGNACTGDSVDVNSYTGSVREDYGASVISSGYQATNAGKYSTTATSLDNANYTLTGCANTVRNWEVKRRTLTASWSDCADTSDNSFIYSGLGQGRTLSLTNAVGGQAISLTVTTASKKLNDHSASLTGTGLLTPTTSPLSLSASGTSRSQAYTAIRTGYYTVSVSLNTAVANMYNYSLAGTTSTNWSIKLAPLTFSWKIDGEDKTGVEYSATSHTASVVITGMVNNETVTPTYGGTTVARNKGDYTATVTAIDSENYSMPSNTSFPWKITPRLITARWSTTDYTYNGQYQYPTITIDKLFPDDDVYFQISFYANENNSLGTSLGTARVFSGTGATQYTFGPSTSGTHAAGETIDAGSYYIRYDGVVYTDASVQNPNYSYEGTLSPAAYVIAKKKLDGSGDWNWKQADTGITAYTNSTHLVYNKKAYRVASMMNESQLVTRVGASSHDSIVYQLEGTSNWYKVTYSGGNYTLTLATASEVSSAAVKISFTNHNKTDEGGYTAQIVVTAANYELGNLHTNLSWRIYPKTIGLSWTLDGSSTLSKTYDGEPHTMAATATGLESGDSCTVTLSDSGKSATLVGSYTATASTLSNHNYTLPATPTQAWTIVARPVVLSWNTNTFEYDSTAKTVSATITNKVGSDDVSLSYTNATKTLAGSYTATVTLTGTKAGQYTLTGGTNTSWAWTITQKQLVAAFGTANLTYNGGYQGIVLTITGVGVNDRTQAKLTVTASLTKPSGITAENIVHDRTAASGYTITYQGIDAGTYTAVISALTGSAKDNYLMPVAGTRTGSFEIKKLPIAVVWNHTGDTGTWSGWDVTYDGASHSVTPTCNNQQTRADTSVQDTVTLTRGNSYSGTNVNTYTANVSAQSHSNYTLTGGSGLTQSWRVVQRTLTVSGWSWANSKLAGGTYTSGSTTLTYNASEYTLTASVSNLVSGESVTLNYSNNVKTNAGSYTATVTLDASASNYTMAATDLSWSISKKNLTVSGWTWANTDEGSGTYTHGTTKLTYNGKAYTLSAVLSGLQGSDNVDSYLSYTNNSKTAAGTYTANVSINVNTNYTLTSASRQWTIAKRDLTTSFSSASLTYNKTQQGIALTVGNVVAGDVSSLAIGNFTYTATGSTVTTGTGTNSFIIYFKATNAGTYSISLTAISSSASPIKNYNLPATASGSYTINPKTVTVTSWSTPTSWTYDGATHTVTANFTSEAAGAGNASDGKWYTGDSLTFDYVDNSKSAAGNYTAKVSLDSSKSGNENYVMTQASQSWSIGQREVTLTWVLRNGGGVFSVVYNGKNRFMDATAGNLVSGDTCTVTVDHDTATANTQASCKNVGDYTAQAVSLSNANYKLPATTTKDWHITQLDVTVSWALSGSETNSVEYDAVAHTVAATVTNVCEGDTVTVTAYTGTTSATAKGDYSATVSTVSNSNYKVPSGLTYSWHITPITLAISFTGTTFTYSAAEQDTMKATVSKIASGDLDGVKITFATTGTTGVVRDAGVVGSNYVITYGATTAGTYTAAISAITGASSANYVLPAVTSATFTVNPYELNVSWTAAGGTYKAAAYSAVASYTLLGSDTATLTYRTIGTSYDVTGGSGTGNIATNASNYRTTITAISNANYVIKAGTGAVEWTISPKNITTITWGSDTFDYDNAPHSLVATIDMTATAGSTTADGKVFSTDSSAVTVTYSSSVTTNRGMSAISGNTATYAGVYSVSVSGLANGNYTVASNSHTLTINRRTVTVSYTASSTFTYNGAEQGFTVTLGNIISADNNDTNLYLSYTFNGTAKTASHSGTGMTQRFVGKNHNTYTLSSVSLAGAKSSNYTLASAISATITINQKAITDSLTNTSIVYDAAAIAASDLGITFATLASGESLVLGTDYSVAFSQSGSPVASVTNVGNYTATVTLLNTTKANNYSLTDTGNAFSVIPYTITPAMLTWSTALDAVVYQNISTNNTITATITDPVFAAANSGSTMSLSQVYFGFCNCGLSATQLSDLDSDHQAHQWFSVNGSWRTAGPVHAGQYWTVLTLSGTGSANFTFSNDFDRYTDSHYFLTNNGNTYLKWHDTSTVADSTALPVLGANVTAVGFTVARAHMGFEAASNTAALPFKGDYYIYADQNSNNEPLIPYITNFANGPQYVNVNISYNGGAGVDYTYANYISSSFRGLRNAGTYEMNFVDTYNGGESSVSGCDLYSDGATVAWAVTLTITQSKVTVTNTSERAWSKRYDHTAAYTLFGYPTGQTFTSTESAGVITSTTDGVITGTDLTISAAFSAVDVSASGRSLTFSLSGTDAVNYYLVFKDDASHLTDTDIITDSEASSGLHTYTLDAGTYTASALYGWLSNGDGGFIEPRVITVIGDTHKEYDGTNAIHDYSVDSSQILPEDVDAGVRVEGYYAQADVGTGIAITLQIPTSTNNYIIGTLIAGSGNITPKEVTVGWEYTGAYPYTYNQSAQGVRLTVSGMITGHYETITVTPTNFSTSNVTGNGVTTFSQINAGTYSVTLALGANSNYTFGSQVVYKEWTISTITLGLSFVKDGLADGAYIYDWTGYSVVFSNVARSVTPTISGVLSGDDVTVTIDDTTGTAVANHTASATGLTGDEAANYVLPAVTSQAWSITKSDVATITLTDLSVTYDATYQTLAVNKTTSQHGVSLGVTYTITPNGGSATAGNSAKDVLWVNSAVSYYTVQATIAATTNYNAWSASARLTINPATISGITMTGLNVLYDADPHTVSVSGTTTSLGDTVSVAYRLVGTEAGGTAVDTAAHSATTAGSYTVTATLTNANYTTLALNASLIIRTRAISVTWAETANYTGVYSRQAQGYTLTIGNIVSGDTVTVDLKKTFYGVEETINISSNNTYTYTATNASPTRFFLLITGLGGSHAQNYTLPDNKSAAFDIVKKTLSVSGWNWSDGTNSGTGRFSFVYAKCTYTLTPVISGIISGDEASVSTTVNDNTGINVGS
ncbi:MAG: hypothetical protein J5755_01200, partial [Clostridia bacterium]|nr:hypothetical protein [Clostridia bacterium]